jgi:hypothetical protein
MQGAIDVLFGKQEELKSPPVMPESKIGPEKSTPILAAPSWSDDKLISTIQGAGSAVLNTLKGIAAPVYPSLLNGYFYSELIASSQNLCLAAQSTITSKYSRTREDKASREALLLGLGILLLGCCVLSIINMALQLGISSSYLQLGEEIPLEAKAKIQPEGEQVAAANEESRINFIDQIVLFAASLFSKITLSATENAVYTSIFAEGENFQVCRVEDAILLLQNHDWSIGAPIDSPIYCRAKLIALILSSMAQRNVLLQFILTLCNALISPEVAEAKGTSFNIDGVTDSELNRGAKHLEAISNYRTARAKARKENLNREKSGKGFKPTRKPFDSSKFDKTTQKVVDAMLGLVITTKIGRTALPADFGFSSIEIEKQVTESYTTQKTNGSEKPKRQNIYERCTALGLARGKLLVKARARYQSLDSLPDKELIGQFMDISDPELNEAISFTIFNDIKKVMREPNFIDERNAFKTYPDLKELVITSLIPFGVLAKTI